MAGLASLFGHEAAIRALRRALETEHLPGAYLFVGAPGVGKGALGRAFAQTATCLTPVHDPFDACGVCDSCRRAESGMHPEIMVVRPAGEQIQIWQFWSRDNKPPGLLSRTLAFAPSIGRRRVYLIEMAETLTESAANSLLKALEEPPPYALFVLLASHTARMLPTIVSRSQVIRLRALPADTLADYLESQAGLPPDRAAMLAAYSEGRIGQAMHLARSPQASEEIGKVLDLAESLPDAPRVRALRVGEQIRKLAVHVRALVGEEPLEESGEESEGTTPKDRAGRRQLAAVFDLLAAFYRDLLALRVCGDEARVVNRERKARLVRLARSGSPERWTRCLDALLLARRRLDANANIALVTESLAMRLLE